MLGLLDLKAEMAACWKSSWNVDPAASIVPLTAAAAELAGAAAEEPVAAGVLDEDVELDELDEHAAMPTAIAITAPPTVMARPLLRTCISDLLLGCLTRFFLPGFALSVFPQGELPGRRFGALGSSPAYSLAVSVLMDSQR